MEKHRLQRINCRYMVLITSSKLSRFVSECNCAINLSRKVYKACFLVLQAYTYMKFIFTVFVNNLHRHIYRPLFLLSHSLMLFYDSLGTVSITQTITSILYHNVHINKNKQTNITCHINEHSK